MLLDLLLVCIFFNFSVCPVWWTKLAGYTSAFYCMLNTQYRIVMKIDQLSFVSMFLRVSVKFDNDRTIAVITAGNANNLPRL